MKFSWKGCLIGCAAFVLLCIILVVASGYWLVKKGDFEASGTILREDTQLFLRADLRAEDELLIGFLTQQLSRMNDMSPVNSGLPGFFKDWQRNQTRGDIEKMLPMEIEISANTEREALMGTVGFSVYNNLASFGFWLLKRAAAKEGHVKTSNGKEYLDVGDHGEPFYFTLIDSVLYFSQTQADMEDILEPQIIDHREDPRFAGVAFDSPVYGFMTGESIETLISNFLLRYEVDTTADEMDAFVKSITRLGYHLKMRDESALEGDLFIEMPPSAANEMVVKTILDTIRNDAQLTVETKVETEENGYMIHYTISGFHEAFGNLEKRFEEMRDRKAR